MSLAASPADVIIEIITYLSPHDLTQLSRTCKSINEITGPYLWRNIELHNLGYHESSSELDCPPPFTPASKRPYLGPGLSDRYENRHSTMFFQLLYDIHSCDRERFSEVASRVKSLCAVVGWNDRYIWHLLPSFTNLEVLELHGQYYPFDIEIRGPSLDRLRFIKLFAYIPPAAVKWILLCTNALERLELGLLDRPVSNIQAEHPAHWPLPEEQVWENGNFVDYGSLDGEWVIPRPLGCVFTQLEITLPNLTHLYLCQPCQNDPSTADQVYRWSSRAEAAALADWRRLLLASSKTLETLVLEQRPGAEELERDIDGEVCFMLNNSMGTGNRALVEMLEEILFQDGAFPSLRHVCLYGFAVGQDFALQPSKSTPGGRLMNRLKKLNVTCEARLGRWTEFEGVNNETSWAEWDGEGREYQDESQPDMRWDTLMARV
ncbi:F-box domain-containing protein [Fusarium sp. Ph1]|nr:F-box domain-containing protein [Fusarium sp. Ph1]